MESRCVNGSRQHVAFKCVANTPRSVPIYLYSGPQKKSCIQQELIKVK